MRTLVLSLLLAPTFALAAGSSVKFPNLPSSIGVSAGKKLRVYVPKAELLRLKPPAAQYQGIPLFNVKLKYKVDGGAVQDLVVAQPHSTGTGGYDGTRGKPSVSIAVPNGATRIDYWLEGTSMVAQGYPGDPNHTRYWSNYGRNFKIDVVR